MHFKNFKFNVTDRVKPFTGTILEFNFQTFMVPELLSTIFQKYATYQEPEPSIGNELQNDTTAVERKSLFGSSKGILLETWLVINPEATRKHGFKTKCERERTGILSVFLKNCCFILPLFWPVFTVFKFETILNQKDLVTNVNMNDSLLLP